MGFGIDRIDRRVFLRAGSVLMALTVLETTRGHERAAAMTLSNGFFTLGTACVFGLGFAVERIGYVAVFRCTAIATMVGAVLLMAWPRVVGVVGRR
jgi:hypothetical protein